MKPEVAAGRAFHKADVELRHAATQYFTGTAEFSDKLKQVEEAWDEAPPSR